MTPSTSSFTLAPELWLRIFRLATLSPTQLETLPSEFAYEPFSAVLWRDRDWFDLASTMHTKRALVLTCRLFRALATEFLLEDVQIRRYTAGLIEGLQMSPVSESGRSEQCITERRGRWAKRIELSANMTDFDPFNPEALVDILKCCPRVELLVRRYSPRGGDPLSSATDQLPSFSALQRVDWWFPPEGDASKGLGFLEDILRHAPHLRYLSLGNRSSSSSSSVYAKSPRSKSVPLLLPALTTLRLELVDPGLLLSIHDWDMPQLTHLIADPSAFERRWSVLKALGKRLRVVELMRHHTFLEKDFIAIILKACPSLQELNYHVDFTIPSLDELHGCSSLHTVRLHTSSPSDFAYSGCLWRYFIGEMLWKHLLGHFHMICGPPTRENGFPSLKRVVLCGEWGDIVSDSKFEPARSLAVERGVDIQVNT